MQAWIDESGAKGQGGWLTLAGFIGKAEEWAVFSDLWSAQLAEAPSIQYLSSREAAGLYGEFHRWPAWQRDAKVRRLARMVNDFHLMVIAISVELAAYTEFFHDKAIPQIARKGPEAKRIRTFNQEPYFFCFHNMCTAVCLELRRRGVTEEIDLFFDKHDLMEPRIREWYPLYLSGLEPDERDIMPSDPLFRDDTRFMPLQVADLAAWTECSDLSGINHPFWRLGKEMKVGRSIYCAAWNRERFRRFYAYAQSDESWTPGSAAYEEKLRGFLGMSQTGLKDCD